MVWFEITKCWLQFKKKNIVSFIIIFGTLSFPIAHVCGRSAGTPATTNRCRRCRCAQTKIMNFSSLDGNRSILACSSIGGGGALCQQGRRQAGVYLLCTLVYKLFTVLTERSTAPPSNRPTVSHCNTFAWRHQLSFAAAAVQQQQLLLELR